MGQKQFNGGPGGPVTPESLEHGLEYSPVDGDVIVCSPPRSGTTWVVWMTHQILERGKSDPVHLMRVAPWLEACPRGTDATLESTDLPRAVKTHLPLGLVRMTDTAKYILVLRDPADSLVSRFHHQKEMLGWPFAASLSDILEREINSDALDGMDDTNTAGRGMKKGWARFVARSWQHVNRDNVLFVRYEELKADFLSQLVRIASFLDVDLMESEIGEVTRKCSFEYMKEHQSVFAPPHKKIQHIRNGGVGSANEALSEEDRVRLRDAIRGQLEARKSTFPFVDFYGNES